MDHHERALFGASTRRGCACGALAVMMVVLGGCGKRETRTVEQVQQSYAESMVKGLDFGLQGRVTAKAYDQVTYRLADVSIDAGDAGIIHADYGDIVVDAVKDTVSLRLQGVVIASTKTGAMTEQKELVTAPVALHVDVVP